MWNRNETLIIFNIYDNASSGVERLCFILRENASVHLISSQDKPFYIKFNGTLLIPMASIF